TPPGIKGLDTHTPADQGIIEPPDTIAAAGPNYVVEIVNSEVMFYNRNTGITTSETLDEFFAPLYPGTVAAFFSHLYVAYYESINRFFIPPMDINAVTLQSFFDFAISDGPDPTSFTEMHQIETDEISPRTQENEFTDFPRVGWNANAYVVSFNMFGFFTETAY